MSVSHRVVAVCAAIVILSGCASLAPERGYAETRKLVQARRGVAPESAQALAAGTEVELPDGPLDASQLVELAFRYSPRLREQYARLGLGRAALEDARRMPNPGFGYSRLRGDEGSKITRSVSFGLGDALLLPLRKRLADAEFGRLEQAIAADLLELAADVETAWYSAATATQVASMRDLVAQAASRSAELARRFFDAGNIDRLQLEREMAAEAQARIDAARSHAEAKRSRASVAALVGLAVGTSWKLSAGIPAPPPHRFEVAELLALAREQRFDLAAANAGVKMREQALMAVRRWRWLGSVDIGYERESEPGGARMRGPSLDLEIPIFDQGQGELARADAELMKARAESDALALSVENDVRLAVDRLGVARDIVDRYRMALLPRREAIVARTQERVNFMLAGVFELIQARQAEYDAYQEYLEAVRDYWIALADLRRACGGRLPSLPATDGTILGIEAILPADEAAPPAHHDHHGSSGPSGAELAPPAESEADPHARHEAASMDHSNHAGQGDAQGAEGDGQQEEASKESHEPMRHEHGDSP